GVVEEREELIVFVMLNRIVLVRVAAHAVDRQSEPYGADRLRAVKDGVDTVLFLIDASFFIGQRLTQKGRRQVLPSGSARQQVAGDLFDRELVERHVGVMGGDDPVAE